MASFTDQFTRHDPWQFKPPPSIASWADKVLMDARGVVNGIETTELIWYAERLETTLNIYANPDQYPQYQVRTNYALASESEPESKPKNARSSPQEAYGDMKLLLAHYEGRHFPTFNAVSEDEKLWHLLATLAIWKVIDALDSLLELPIELSSAASLPRTSNIMAHTALAAEAQAAACKANEFASTSKISAAMDRMKGWIDQRDLHERSSNGGRAKGKKTVQARDYVVQLAQTTTKKFHNQMKLAEWLCEQTRGFLGVEVKPSTVLTWLRQEGLTKKTSQLAALD